MIERAWVLREIDALSTPLLEMTKAVYEGSDDDRKIALSHLLDAFAELRKAFG